MAASSKFNQMTKKRVFTMRLKAEEWILRSASATFRISSSSLSAHSKTISQWTSRNSWALTPKWALRCSSPSWPCFMREFHAPSSTSDSVESSRRGFSTDSVTLKTKKVNLYRHRLNLSMKVELPQTSLIIQNKQERSITLRHLCA